MLITSYNSKIDPLLKFAGTGLGCFSPWAKKHIFNYLHFDQ